jgi:hypothetical protein
MKATMVENRFENMSSGDPQPVAGISRRELLKRGGEVAAAAAVSSVFSPFVFTGKAAAKKDFFPSVTEARIVDEKIYGVPFDVEPMAMYYSLKAFEEANSQISPRKSALEKGATEGGYSSAPMKLFKDVILPTARCEPRVPPDVSKAVSDTIQACQLSGADPKQAAEEGSQRIESFLSGYTGAPLL